MRFLLSLVFFIGAFAQAATTDTDTQQIRALVKSFHALDSHFVLCADKEGRSQPERKDQYYPYFSTSLAQLYSSQCTAKWRRLSFDPRYGDSPLGAKDFSRKIEHLKIGAPKINGNSATVRVTYDYSGGYAGDAPYSDWGHYIVYKLVKEGGQWKIDDMAIGGNDFREMEMVFQNYKSLKEELRREVAAEQKERKQRGIPVPQR